MFINKRFYIALTFVILCFIAGFKSTFIFSSAQLLLLALVALCGYECIALFITDKRTVTCKRVCPERLSNGDENEIVLHLHSNYGFTVRLEIIDEISPIFQRRDLLFKVELGKNADAVLRYSLLPVKRGVYAFGIIPIFATTRIGFISRRFKSAEPFYTKVYPSYIYLKQYELMAASNKLRQTGNKKVRQIGQQLEPDQIKDYVKGDDYRIINWKATARRNKLMVNIFQEERAQNVYCIIDKGRTMQAAFNGMTLLDYSINAALAISYVAMLKGDKTGLLTFERKFDTYVPPFRHAVQMNRIQEALYHQVTSFAESDYLALYRQLCKNAKNRGLLLVFTNFDSVAAMQRQLQYLAMMAKNHSVVVIFFEDAELTSLVGKIPENKAETYETVIAEKLIYEKQLITRKLRQHNILSLLTHPNELTVNVINKYLEIKARGNW
ncbi:MAG: DUF58 domain-containing protein [Candidatus Symbiothrix sp.]|jgi:uncharacterized protein (DUF58 family)|nr:DUF58 domain-containing protein [Candidatus Symbiothrix sp.]